MSSLDQFRQDSVKDFVSIVSVFFKINQLNWFELIGASLLEVVTYKWHGKKKTGHIFYFSQN